MTSIYALNNNINEELIMVLDTKLIPKILYKHVINIYNCEEYLNLIDLMKFTK